MRTVFNNSEIAHVWSAQQQQEGRTSNGTLYFRGATIYSYGSHFPIAKMMPDGKVLFTLRSYSNTTRRHIGHVLEAVSHLNKIYCYNPSESAVSNFKAWEGEIAYIAKSLAKARKPEIYLGKIASLLQQAITYSEYVSEPLTDGLVEYSKLVNRDDFLAYQEELRGRAEAKRLAQIKAEKAKRAKALKEWKAGKRNYAYDLTHQLVRETGEGDVITTKGVVIKRDEARAIYLGIKSSRVKVDDRVALYRVTSITNSEIVISCHRFKKKHLLEVGDKMFNL